MPTGPVCLIVLDGYGIGTGGAGDATAAAPTPFFDRAAKLYPTSRIETSGPAVGLPEGQMGNSEVGHMTLGAGRILDQDIGRIRTAIEAGALEREPAALRLFEAAGSSGRLHLMGLISSGGVHSSLDHLDGVLDALAARGIQPILHAFTDGRDTPPRSALQWIEPLERRLREAGGSIATVTGRYWAMDRDQRWDRVARAYRALVETGDGPREGVQVQSAVEAVEKAYGRDEGDEFIQPSLVAGGAGIQAGDAVLHLNFRADRARELSNAITRTASHKLGAEIEALPSVPLASFTTMTVYDDDFDLPALFAPLYIPHSFGELVSRAGHPQLRIAETEKYAHVTYFFNGGREEPFEGEQRILVPSPRDVPTYDLKPEMSAIEVADRLIEALESEAGAPRFVLANFANPDMVGHTGSLPASVRAVEVVDACLDRIASRVLARDGALLVTADHGNIEQLIDPGTGGPHTAHTTNPVPAYWVTSETAGRALADGGLSDIAPTLCDLLDLEIPDEMTGRSLLR